MSKNNEEKIEKELIKKGIDLLIEKLETFKEKVNEESLSKIISDISSDALLKKISKTFYECYKSYLNYQCSKDSQFGSSYQDLDDDQISKKEEQKRKNSFNTADLYSFINKELKNKDKNNNETLRDIASNLFKKANKESEDINKHQETFLLASINLIKKHAEDNKKNFETIDKILLTDIFEVLLLQYSDKMVSAIKESSFFETNEEWKENMSQYVLTKVLLETIFYVPTSQIGINTIRANIKKILFFDISQRIHSLLDIKELEERITEFGGGIAKAMKALFNFFYEKKLVTNNPFNNQSPYLQLSVDAYGRQITDLINYVFSQSKEQLNTSLYKDLMDSSFLVNIEDILYPEVKLESYDEFFSITGPIKESVYWYSKDMIEKFPHFSRLFEYYVKDPESLNVKNNPLALQIIRSYLIFLIVNDISNIYFGKEFTLSDIKKELKIIADSISRLFIFSYRQEKEKHEPLYAETMGDKIKDEIEKQIESIKSRDPHLINLV